MIKGYKYLAQGAGAMLITGFFLPWLSKGPFHFSGMSFAMLGYPVLFLLPISGIAVFTLVLTKKHQRPGYLLYPGMAGILCFILFTGLIQFSDTGSIQFKWYSKFMEFVHVTTGSNLIMFNPVKDMGQGLLFIIAGLLIIIFIPCLNGTLLDAGKNTKDSYQSIIKKPLMKDEYKRFTFILISLGILITTYLWCGISPVKLWENRGNAREYIFGRELTSKDMDSIKARAERAPQIEAAGRAEEFMSKKYRKIPLSEQPGPSEKAKERDAFRDKILARMDISEKEGLKKQALNNALKDKKGGYFPPETSLIKLKGYLSALVETIAIAVWGTMLAVLCAVPVSFFAATNTLELIIPSDDIKSRSMRLSIAFAVRRFLDSCRGFNEFVMALIFVAVIGLGPYAGILALWIHTFGILGKVFSEQIEAIESGQVEALTSTGAGAVQVIVFSIMPQVLPGLVSYTLLRFESNVRSAAILGFVGAGGIGFLIFDKLNGYLFQEVCTIMIIIIITVGIIDHFCGKIRMRFI